MPMSNDENVAVKPAEVPQAKRENSPQLKALLALQNGLMYQAKPARALEGIQVAISTLRTLEENDALHAPAKPDPLSYAPNFPDKGPITEEVRASTQFEPPKGFINAICDLANAMGITVGAPGGTFGVGLLSAATTVMNEAVNRLNTPLDNDVRVAEKAEVYPTAFIEAVVGLADQMCISVGSRNSERPMDSATFIMQEAAKVLRNAGEQMKIDIAVGEKVLNLFEELKRVDVRFKSPLVRGDKNTPIDVLNHLLNLANNMPDGPSSTKFGMVAEKADFRIAMVPDDEATAQIIKDLEAAKEDDTAVLAYIDDAIHRQIPRSGVIKADFDRFMDRYEEASHDATLYRNMRDRAADLSIVSILDFHSFCDLLDEVRMYRKQREGTQLSQQIERTLRAVNRRRGEASDTGASTRLLDMVRYIRQYVEEGQ